MAGTQKSPWNAIHFSKWWANSFRFSWHVEWVFRGCPGHPAVLILSIPRRYGWSMVIFFPTAVSQKSMEICFRRRGLSRFTQPLIPTRALQLMRDSGSLPTSRCLFIFQSQGRKTNLQWFFEKSIKNIGFSLFQSHEYASAYRNGETIHLSVKQRNERTQWRYF